VVGISAKTTRADAPGISWRGRCPSGHRSKILAKNKDLLARTDLADNEFSAADPRVLTDLRLLPKGKAPFALNFNQTFHNPAGPVVVHVARRPVRARSRCGTRRWQPEGHRVTESEVTFSAGTPRTCSAGHPAPVSAGTPRTCSAGTPRTPAPRPRARPGRGESIFRVILGQEHPHRGGSTIGAMVVGDHVEASLVSLEHSAAVLARRAKRVDRRAPQRSSAPSLWAEACPARLHPRVGCRSAHARGRDRAQAPGRFDSTQ
jgi:hypothetical protein